MKMILALFIVLLWSGCTLGSGTQARFLSGADTKQAIALEASQDPKLCEHIRGSGAAYGITGMIDRYFARGKNVTMQDCMNLFNKTINPQILP